MCPGDHYRLVTGVSGYAARTVGYWITGGAANMMETSYMN